MTKAVLKTRMVGYATHRTGHVMAPPDVVYEVEEAPRKHIPLGAKLCGWFIILGGIYSLIQGGINTYNNYFAN